MEADPLVIETEFLPDAVAGEVYDFLLAASGGLKPYRWEVGTEESWLSMKAGTGRLGGMPAEAAVKVPVIVRVIDNTYGEGQTARRTFSLSVGYCDSHQLHPCSDRGTCEEGTCVCDTGYVGNLCETCTAGFHREGFECIEGSVCEEGACSGHGDCDDSTGIVLCICDIGYSGSHCGECAAEYYEEGGICVIVAFTGRTEVVSTFKATGEEVTICDAVVELVGTPHFGDCDECDFDFDIQATIIEDNGSPDCRLWPMLSWIERDGYTDLRMAHAEQKDEWSNVFMAGYRIHDAGFDLPGPEWFVISFEESPGGTFSRTGNEIAWSYDSYTRLTAPRAFTPCSFVKDSRSTIPLGGATMGRSDLDCSAEVMDVWAFDAVAGQTLSFTVDTIAADTVFRPGLLINRAATTCTIANAWDNFDCSHGGRCPSVLVDIDEGGTYHAVVMLYGNCSSSIAEYEIRTDASDLRLELDNFFVAIVDPTIHMQTIGSGTLAP